MIKGGKRSTSTLLSGVPLASAQATSVVPSSAAAASILGKLGLFFLKAGALSFGTSDARRSAPRRFRVPCSAADIT
jgi:hypothetical protein